MKESRIKRRRRNSACRAFAGSGRLRFAQRADGERKSLTISTRLLAFQYTWRRATAGAPEEEVLLKKALATGYAASLKAKAP